MYLIVGASGFIGNHIYDYCKRKNIPVLGTYCTNSYNKDWIKFDLCNSHLEDICSKYAPKEIIDAVIVCGANSSIDSCKKNENDSNKVNVIGTKRVLKQADEMGIKSVFLSSEAVFDGNRGMYTEEDYPHPITLYGNQKLEIERYILQNLKKYLIFRISRATGSKFREKDILNEFYNKITNNEEIICLKNQSFCLTEVNDIAKAIIVALEKNIEGIYHLSSNNYISRYNLANLYAQKVFGGYESILEKDYDEIQFLDKRHIYGGLKGDKLSNLLGIEFMSIENILNGYFTSFERERNGWFA